MKKFLSVLIIAVLCISFMSATNTYIFAETPKALPNNYSEFTANKLYDKWIESKSLKNTGNTLTLNFIDDTLIKNLPLDVFNANSQKYLADINSVLEMAIPFSGFNTSYSVKYGGFFGKKSCVSIETKLELTDYNKYLAVQPKAQSIANSIKAKATTDRERVTLLNKYLIENVRYDTTYGANLAKNDKRVWESWGALTDGVAVCSGYVNAFSQICQAMNIPVVSVVGYRDKDVNNPNELGHEWNEVFIENKWQAVDVTSNDPVIISGNMSETAKYNKYGKQFLFMDVNTLKTLKFEWDDEKLQTAKKMIYPKLAKQ